MIFNMADGILTPCNVPCGSGIVTVNSPSGSTLQCDTSLWNHDIEFARWQHRTMSQLALGWHAIEFTQTSAISVKCPCTKTEPILIIKPRSPLSSCAVLYANYHVFSFLFGVRRSLCMPALRPALQAGVMCNPREGTSVVLCDTIRLTRWCV